jgi:hypothetical protein
MSILKLPTSKLGWAVLIALLCSLAHLTHNVAFFHHYPEPSWLNARLLDVWSVVAVIALIVGYLMWQREWRISGMACMLVFLLSSLTVIMHYKYDGAANMTLLMHALIWLQFIPTLWLAYELARVWRSAREPRFKTALTLSKGD